MSLSLPRWEPRRSQTAHQGRRLETARWRNGGPGKKGTGPKPAPGAGANHRPEEGAPGGKAAGRVRGGPADARQGKAGTSQGHRDTGSSGRVGSEVTTWTRRRPRGEAGDCWGPASRVPTEGGSAGSRGAGHKAHTGRREPRGCPVTRRGPEHHGAFLKGIPDASFRLSVLKRVIFL